ncbi:hypothetical protein BDV96DRAFT_598664 [Lophiotrema nucula]|uniref:Uncharacterized protein n=1 Tax=Lophiotrema nucula TaxID=690887 RepID=A0A6A5ZEP8_9PLEO|nr:hypothetical protein BDV96DRAFT_598664 [Lophiotrema nucula]
MNQPANIAVIPSTPPKTSCPLYRVIKHLYKAYYNLQLQPGLPLPIFGRQPTATMTNIGTYPTLWGAQAAVRDIIANQVEYNKSVGIVGCCSNLADLNTMAVMTGINELGVQVPLMKVEIQAVWPQKTQESAGTLVPKASTQPLCSEVLVGHRDGHGGGSQGKPDLPEVQQDSAKVQPNQPEEQVDLPEMEALPLMVHLSSNDKRHVYKTPKLGVAWKKEADDMWTQTKRPLWSRRSEFPLAKELSEYGEIAPLKPVRQRDLKENLMRMDWLGDLSQEHGTDHDQFEDSSVQGPVLKYSGGVPGIKSVYGV